jgi:hypothetical protein
MKLNYSLLVVALVIPLVFSLLMADGEGAIFGFIYLIFAVINGGLGVIFSIPKSTRESGLTFLLAAGLTLLIGGGLCSVSDFQI